MKVILSAGTSRDGFHVTIRNLRTFEWLALEAKKAGVTHLEISGLTERSSWEIADPDDPYLQWHLESPGLFKIFPPREMQTHVPAAFAAANLRLIVAKGRILRRHGLRAFYSCREPAWMPESVFERHPEWRGPRVDHPCRSKHSVFSPCLDHPEILTRYRAAARKLATAVPVLDEFLFITNDSANGICWGSGLYNNPNGPMRCKDADMGKRIAGFLSAIQEGAGDTGVAVGAFIHGKFSLLEAASVRIAATPRTGLRPASQTGTASWFNPVKPLTDHLTLLTTLCEATDTGRLRIHLADDEPDTLRLYLKVIRFAVQSPARGRPARTEFILSLAGKEVGQANAEILVDFWEQIAAAKKWLNCSRTGYLLFLGGDLAERWLVRPLVPFPLELTADEKDYYRRHQFQAMSEEDAADLTNIQGIRFVDSRRGFLLARGIVDSALAHLRDAGRALDALVPLLTSPRQAKYYRRMQERLQASVCLIHTALNAWNFQTLLEAIQKMPPSASSSVMGSDDMAMTLTIQSFYPTVNIPRAEIYTIARAELDNTQQLIALLKRAKDCPLYLGRRTDQEDTFTLSPSLVSQLEKKSRTMLAH